MIGANRCASSFETLFAYTAASENMPHMCIPTALRFRLDVCVGETAIYPYIEQLAKQGGYRVVNILQTEVLEKSGLKHGDSQMRNCGIVTVGLLLPIATSFSTVPNNKPGAPLNEQEIRPAVRYLTKALADTYKTWLPIIDYVGWV